MRHLKFQIVNVFSLEEDPFSGNPLCVFEDGEPVDDHEMQALGRQTNLSETTFIVRPRTPGATARVRIFTPTSEMAFAGHPTLGTAHVLAALGLAPGRVVLELAAGIVPVDRDGDEWTLEAPSAPRVRAPEASASQLAAMVGVPEEALGGAPLWVNTGVEQLVVPLAAVTDVHRARPSAALLDELAARTDGDKRAVYVWARDPGAPGRVLARYFFLQHGAVTEDPATGSACANLGGWLLATGQTKGSPPVTLDIDQGGQVGRPSRLSLRVVDGKVLVGGRVTAVGRGELLLPDRRG